MKYGELVRRLRRLGVRRIEQRKRHEMWYNAATDRYSYLPRHRGEIAPGTLTKVLHELGISRKEFERGKRRV